MLLHHFIKKTQKTPTKEIETAKRRLKELLERERSKKMSEYTTWDEFEKTIFTPEEIAESNLRVALIGELIKARNEKGITQKKLEELSGVKQPIIARMEKGHTNAQIETILKILAPLGKTLAVVPIS